jgi:hypothetical protein
MANQGDRTWEKYGSFIKWNAETAKRAMFEKENGVPFGTPSNSVD